MIEPVTAKGTYRGHMDHRSQREARIVERLPGGPDCLLPFRDSHETHEAPAERRYVLARVRGVPSSGGAEPGPVVTDETPTSL
jgi:hypothetical protein